MKFHNVFSGSAGWGKILETPNLNEGGVGGDSGKKIILL